MTDTFADIARIQVDPVRARVYAEGWQSWTPARLYAPGDQDSGPADERLLDHFWRRGASYDLPDRARQADGGLLAIDPGTGDDVVVVVAPDPGHVPVVRAAPSGDRTYMVTATGPCTCFRHPGPIRDALAAWAAQWPSTWGPQWRPGGARWTFRDDQSPGTAWCSWYALRRRFDYTTLDAAIDTIAWEKLPISTVQIDDGYMLRLGDWRTSVRSDLGSLEAMAVRIRDRGLQAGLWLCPTLADVTSDIVAARPQVWVPGVDAPFGGKRRVRIVDSTAPAGAEYLSEVITDVVSAGFTWLKLDFLWTGALPGPRASGADPISAYREALRVIRQAAGDKVTLIGSGAVLIPSVCAGLTAVRTSPDVGPVWEPPGGDLS